MVAKYCADFSGSMVSSGGTSSMESANSHTGWSFLLTSSGVPVTTKVLAMSSGTRWATLR